ncbi:hypothetical protein V1521DRAFT_429210 [Lipomyces starkeyi]
MVCRILLLLLPLRLRVLTRPTLLFVMTGRRRQPPRVDGDAYVARTRFRTGDAFPSPSDAGAYDRRQLLTPWGLKYCSNCNRLWCRDKIATHNVFSRMVFLPAQPKGAVANAVAESRQDGPGYLCRQVRQEQDDAPAPKSKRVAKSNRDDRAVDATTPVGKRQQAIP